MIFVSLSAPNDDKSIELHKAFFTDTASSLSVEQVMNKDASSFVAYEQQARVMFNESLWFKATVPLALDNDQRLIEITNSSIDDIQVWFISNSTQEIVASHLSGDSLDYYQRPVLHEAFLFPVPSTSEQLTLLLKVTSAGALEVQTRVWDKLDFIAYDGANKFFVGAFAGAMLVSLLLCGMLYVFTMDQKSLVFAAFLFCTTVALLAAHGILFKFIWPESVWLQARATIFFAAAAAAVFIQYSISELSIKSHSNVLYRILLAFKILLIIFAVYSVVLPNALLMIGVALITAIAYSTLFFAVLKLSMSGLVPRNLYSVALASLFITIGLIALDNYGFLEIGTRPINVLIVGVLIKTMFMTFGLATSIAYQHRLDTIIETNEPISRTPLETSSEQAQSNTNSSDDEFTQTLEYKVDERTLELEIALRELSDVNKELERLSSTDALTDVMNRRFFDKRLLAEARRSRRERTMLSVAVFDIDFFKKINDEHGHMAGDECLKQFAQVLKQNIKRPADVICRYGGEEFVVIMPATDLDGAVELMEKVRSDVERLSVEFERSTITFTVSIGLTSKVLDNEEEKDAVVTFADKLLYQAKASGRNKLVAKPFSMETDPAVEL
ncbi:MAG: diguanylate cyclase [Pseudomonadota bacterium]